MSVRAHLCFTLTSDRDVFAVKTLEQVIGIHTPYNKPAYTTTIIFAAAFTSAYEALNPPPRPTPPYFATENGCTYFTIIKWTHPPNDWESRTSYLNQTLIEKIKVNVAIESRYSVFAVKDTLCSFLVWLLQDQIGSAWMVEGTWEPRANVQQVPIRSAGVGLEGALSPLQANEHGILKVAATFLCHPANCRQWGDSLTIKFVGLLRLPPLEPEVDFAPAISEFPSTTKEFPISVIPDASAQADSGQTSRRTSGSRGGGSASRQTVSRTGTFYAGVVDGAPVQETTLTRVWDGGSSRRGGPVNPNESNQLTRFHERSIDTGGGGSFQATVLSPEQIERRIGSDNASAYSGTVLVQGEDGSIYAVST